MRSIRLIQILIAILLLLITTLFLILASIYEININVEQLVSQRIAVIILTKDGQRNTSILKRHFPQARIAQGNSFSTEEIDSAESVYKEKYVQELEYFVKHGRNMLVMLLEDDVVSIYNNQTMWYHLALNTIPLFSNDLANFDCSKRGFFVKTGSDGNKSLCRIFSKETLNEQIKCLRSIPDPIDVSINYCQEKLDITQKRFLIFAHTGMPSLIGHYDAEFAM